MKILVAHTAYQQKGGEDTVFHNETALLEEAGHDVHRLVLTNDHISGFKAKALAAVHVLKNPDSVSLFSKALQDFKPDIVHIHNFFPTLSPAVIECAAEQKVPVVLTLHNFRPLCVGGILLRDGQICEDCVTGTRLSGLLHRCYRNSLIGSACVSTIGPYLKKLISSYPNTITLIALTHFAKSRYLKGNFPDESIVVRGNCLNDIGRGEELRDNKILYIGRMTKEKGVETFLQAASDLDINIDLIGDGPEKESLQKYSSDKVRFLGLLSPKEVMAHLKKAQALVVPSHWYEGFPMVVLEAMATGTPLLVSEIGSLAEIVQDHKTGRVIPAGDVEAWRKTLIEVYNNEKELTKWGLEGRKLYEENFSPSAGIASLEKIYKDAIEKFS